MKIQVRWKWKYIPRDPDILYAAAWHGCAAPGILPKAAKHPGYIKARMADESWSLLTNAGSGFPQGDGVGRIGLAVSPQKAILFMLSWIILPTVPIRLKGIPAGWCCMISNRSPRRNSKLSDTQLDRFLRINGLQGS